MTQTAQIFDRTALHQRKRRSLPAFPDFDFLHREVAARLSDRLQDTTRSFPFTLLHGCRRGELSQAVLPTPQIQHVLRADLHPGRAPATDCVASLPIIAIDEENQPFNTHSFDAVLSNLTLHTTNDLPGALVQYRLALKPDGLFLAALFGGETLKELRDVLGRAEIEVEGGLSPRIAPFADVRDAGSLMNRAGFALPVVDTDTLTVYYDTPFKLFADLRGMGETNILQHRRKTPLKRDTLMRAATLYMDEYATANGKIPATFQILFLTGWRPDKSQPKPLQPGSATASLADFLNASN
jgi:SAM-dependent methyltransferase